MSLTVCFVASLLLIKHLVVASANGVHPEGSENARLLFAGRNPLFLFVSWFK